jgi:RNA polymerase sigma-70 factor (ECF subfamily)
VVVSQRTNLPDDLLLRQVARGDTAAFDEIYRRHGRTAYGLARRLGASREQAEDIVQETFVAVWRNAGQYSSHRGSTMTWLNSIVRHRVTDAWRRATARPSEVPAEHAPESVARTDTPGVERVAVRSLLSTLPMDQREAVVLAYFGGLTHEQIAAASGTPLGTVKGRLRLGLDKLRFAMA